MKGTLVSCLNRYCCADGHGGDLNSIASVHPLPQHYSGKRVFQDVKIILLTACAVTISPELSRLPIVQGLLPLCRTAPPGPCNSRAVESISWHGLPSGQMWPPCASQCPFLHALHLHWVEAVGQALFWCQLIVANYHVIQRCRCYRIVPSYWTRICSYPRMCGLVKTELTR
jgi:hypothetical protein